MSVIGLDIGTSAVKAVRFDQDWCAADTQALRTVVVAGPGGRSEQDLTAVFDAAADVIAAVAGRSPDPVDVLALTAQGDGCWLVDAAGDPAAPAMLWNDSRAAPLVERWLTEGVLDTAFRISGCYGSPGLANAQLSWLRDHEPSALRRAARLLSCGSWVYRQLTGRDVLEESDAANPFCSADTRRYDDRLLELFGIADLRRLLPEIRTALDPPAPLRPTAAARIGLPAGTPIVLAPYDVVSTAIGCGVVKPGDAFAVLGTTLCVGVVDDDPRLDRPPNGMTLPMACGSWLIAHATMVGTEILDWAARLLQLPDAAAVIALAAHSTGVDVPLLLPYLSPAGERSPFLDSAVRGTMLDLDLRHGPCEMARAILDGLTMAVRDCVQAAGAPQSLAVSGGGARSAAWCQAISDAVGVPVVQPDVDEVGARGAALVGATAVGQFSSLTDAASAVVSPGRRYAPRAEEETRFDARFARFIAARETLRKTPVIHRAMPRRR